MPQITVTITVTKTVAALNGTVLDGILTWIKTNVSDKLPPDASAVIVFSNITL